MPVFAEIQSKKYDIFVKTNNGRICPLYKPNWITPNWTPSSCRINGPPGIVKSKLRSNNLRSTYRQLFNLQSLSLITRVAQVWISAECHWKCTNECLRIGYFEHGKLPGGIARRYVERCLSHHSKRCIEPIKASGADCFSCFHFRHVNAALRQLSRLNMLAKWNSRRQFNQTY